MIDHAIKSVDFDLAEPAFAAPAFVHDILAGREQGIEQALGLGHNEARAGFADNDLKTSGRQPTGVSERLESEIPAGQAAAVPSAIDCLHQAQRTADIAD